MIARDPIETYLEQLATGLSAAGREPDAILAEVRDGLLEAKTAAIAQGLAAPAAAARAAEEFGDPATIAHAFQEDLAARQSRRIAIWLLATGPAIGALWAATAHFSHLVPGLADGHGLLLAIRLALGLAVLTTITAAMLAVGTAGALNRHFTIPARLPPTAAATSLTLAATIDTAALATVALAAISTPPSLAWTIALAAATASSLRLILTTRAARAILVSRRSIPA